MKTDIIEKKSTSKAALVVDDTVLEDDFNSVRSSLAALIEQGNTALTTSLEILVATEQPRCIDSFAGLLKVVAELNTKMLDLHKVKADIKGTSGNNIKANTVTQTANNFFAGSTTDLQKMIAEMGME